MAYHIYTTRGIVLSARPLREADKIYSIFTEELGLVHARARGVRAIQSKLRGALEPFSLSTISLVRGQDTWRLTGAVLHERLNLIQLGTELHKALARVLSLLERLVTGEEGHRELFAVLGDGVRYMVTEATETDSEALEIVLVLRLLYHLGYVSISEEEHGSLHAPLSAELLSRIAQDKKRLIEVINNGLRSSQLV